MVVLVNSVRPAPLVEVKRAIARTMLGGHSRATGRSLGRIVLRRHQVDAASRLLSMVERSGGALLAEPVGLGKTYTALAVVARLGARACVALVPASLRAMWHGAIREAGLDVRVVTHEALSRGGAPAVATDLVVVDESHRLRNPGTRRYAAAAELCARSRVLLVSATPVQNTRDDIVAQLALFLGRRAWALSADELAAHVLRGAPHDVRELPALAGPHAVSLPSDDDCADAILSLPPPVPARGESLAAALLAYGLVHQWTSSRAALVAALERRLARGAALAAVLETGRHPTRDELAAWTWSHDAVQLAFPELVAGGDTTDGSRVAELLAAVRAHHTAIDALLARLRAGADPDDDRAAALRRVRQRHPGERVIAFCHYAETVRAMWTRLRREPGVAALTASGARVAGGRVSREFVMRQLAPARPESTPTPVIERIELLVTTDVLSEGLNLQAASVVVHLDYPWNPARLDQRVGRVRRIGSPHAVVTAYAVAPLASAERLLRIDARLREKLRVAQRTVGVAGRILPSPLGATPGPARDAGEIDPSPAPSAAESASDVRRILDDWLREDDAADRSAAVPDARQESGPDADLDVVPIAAATANAAGFVALVECNGEPMMVADLGAGIESSPATLSRALGVVQVEANDLDEPHARQAVSRMERWLDDRRGAATIDLKAAAGSGSRRLALTRVAQAISRAPRHRRAQLAALATAARAVATLPLAEGAERVLDLLVRSELPDEAWLRSVATFGELNARFSAAGRTTARGRLVAMILLVPPG